MNGDLLDKIHIETRPEKIPNQCIDENVNIFRLRKYFTTEGWQSVTEVIEVKRTACQYYCSVCSCDFEDCVSISLPLTLCCIEMYSTKEGMVLPKLSLK